MSRLRVFLAASASLAAAFSLSACITTEDAEDGVEDAVKQPLRDLSLVKEDIPAPFVQAAAAPYRTLGDCPAITAELKALDEQLGPDLDSGLKRDGVGGAQIVSELLQGALDLPFRGVIRRVTGAHRRDQKRADAIVAGIARRGYLRGLAQERGCLPIISQPS